MMVGAWRDVRLAARSLLAGRTTTAVAWATLALGIGLSAATFSVLDSILWRQVPFVDADRLVQIANVSLEQKFSYTGSSRSLVLEWRRQSNLVDSVEAYERTSFVFESEHGAEMVSGATISPGLVNLLGVRAARGRGFGVGDGRAGADDRAIVSNAFWRRRLQGDPDAIDRVIRLNGRSYRIVGVMPATFRFPSGLEEVWIAYDLDQPPPGAPAPRAWTAVARIANGLTIDSATAAVQNIGEHVGQAAGGPTGISATLTTLGDSAEDRTRRALLVLSGAVACLFLIVCANVANLTLARSASRARDFATYAALGASPHQIIRAAFVEQAILAAAGVAGGVGIAWVSVRVTVASLPDAMAAATLNTIDLDGRALAFMILTGAVATLLFGLPPALAAGRLSVSSVLSGAGRSSSGSRGASRLRGALVTLEVAISVVLIVGAALMARSFMKLAAADSGFDTRNLIALRIGLPATGYADDAVRNRVASDIVASLSSMDGVRAATVGGLPSESNLMAFGAVAIEGRSVPPGAAVPIPVHEVPPEYFSAIGLPVREGRTFQSSDGRDTVVVNERFAHRFFADERVIGQRFSIGRGSLRTIIGVVADTTAAHDDGTKRLELYYPVGTASDAFRPTMAASLVVDFRTFLIRADRPEAVVPRLADVVHASDPALIIWQTTMVEHLMADAIARPRIVFVMMSVFAGFGLLLAMAGIYAVLSHLVAQRRREIGVRLALGGSPQQMRRLVFASGLGFTAIGLAIGLAASIPLARVMQALLFDVSPADPIALVGSAAIVTITAALACWRPARAAMIVSPLDLLRE